MKIRSWLGILLALLCLASLSAGPKPGEGESGHYKVLVMGDAHFDAEEFHKAPPATEGKKEERDRNLKMWKSKSPALFSAAGKRAAAEHAAFAVQLGDLVQGDSDDAKVQGDMIRKAFATLKKNFPGIPLLIVKGNHDIRLLKNGRNNAAANAALLPIISRELGKKVTKNTCYAFMRGRDLFIAVDDFIPARNIEAFVRKTLADHPDTRYVFFMTHLPLMPASVGSPLWLVPGWNTLAGMLQKRNTLILAAHTHAPSLATRTTDNGKLTQLIVSSMGNAWSGKRRRGKYSDWADFSEAAERGVAEAKKSDRARRLWNAWKNSGDFTFRHLFGNSGFVVLEIDEAKVVARYYTNGSAKPAAALELLNNR